MIGKRKTASCELNQRSANKPFLVGDTREKLFRYDFELSESAQKMCLYSKPDLAQLGSPMIVFGSMHQPTDYTNQALVECGRPHSLWNCLLMAHTSQHLTFPSTLYHTKPHSLHPFTQNCMKCWIQSSMKMWTRFQVVLEKLSRGGVVDLNWGSFCKILMSTVNPPGPP